MYAQSYSQFASCFEAISGTNCFISRLFSYLSRERRLGENRIDQTYNCYFQG